MEYCNYNGKLVEHDTALISVNSRGFRFGDGLFETMKSNKINLLFADEHVNRLLHGLELLEFKIPLHFTTDKLNQQVHNLLKKNGHQHMARVRFTVFRGDGGLFDEINHTPNYLIQSWVLPDDVGQWNSNGLVLGIYNDVKKSCDLLSNLKHNNFLPYVMAAMHAKKQKWNDAVLLNNDGRICDTSIANIFLVKDEIIYTPSLKEGCIAGIMRQHIIQQLADNNMQVIESKITLNDLMEADEVFLSNSIYNIRWVQNIGDKKYKSKFTQKIYSMLLPTIL